MKLQIRLILAVLLCSLVFPLAASARQATPDTGSNREGLIFSVVPNDEWPNGYVELELDPTESSSFSARINTEGTDHASLLAFVGNAVNPVNGGFAVTDITEERIGIASWFTLDKEAFELDPGEAESFTVSVTVPENTPPGQYIAGLIVQTAKPLGSDDPQEGFGLLPIIRSAMAIQITVPGPVTAGFELGTPTLTIQNDTPVVSAPITNTGNVLVKPAGTLSVSSPDGTVLVSSPVEMGSVYMGNSTSVQVSLPNQFVAGDYLVSIELTDAATGTSAQQEAVPVTMAAAEATPVTFSVGMTVKADGDPIRFADVSVIIDNGGDTIPTATVKLHVFHDGVETEVYPLSTNQAIPAGDSTINQRYIPTDDWQSGVYTFAVEIVVVDPQTSTETAIGTIESADSITVP
ncbi:hypothetical protein BH09CHL1_BH09CHL1_01150 [soil metagenome]